jgi:hypothetical protein
MDYTRSHHETVTCVDHAWTPSHIRRNETVTVVDAIRVERITFWRKHHETVTAVDTLKRRPTRVGESDTGWRVVDLQMELDSDVEPGDSYTFVVEDQFDYRTLLSGNLRLHNTEGVSLHVTVNQLVIAGGYTVGFPLIDEPIPGHGFLDVPIITPQTIPPKPVVSPRRLVSHEVTLTNNETERNATVVALISGWAGQVTDWPVTDGEDPCAIP